jgi:hypothetical protein
MNLFFFGFGPLGVRLSRRVCLGVGFYMASALGTFFSNDRNEPKISSK